jgi:hypothetical protein
MAGTLALCPPYEACAHALLRVQLQRQMGATNWRDGQITKSMSSPSEKNISLASSGKSDV